MTEPAFLPELEPIDTPEGLDWSRIEAEYRAGKPQRQISQEFGVSQAAISKRAKRDGWTQAVITPADNQPDNKKVGPEMGRAIMQAFNAGMDAARPITEPADPAREDDDWWQSKDNKETIVCRQQQAIAVCVNPVGHLVIREERYWDRDDDTVITIDPAHVPALVKRIYQLMVWRPGDLEECAGRKANEPRTRTDRNGLLSTVRADRARRSVRRAAQRFMIRVGWQGRNRLRAAK